MKHLLATIVIAAAAWSGFWWLNASSVARDQEAWFEARRAQGWQAEFADMALRGFPNRIDTTFSDIALADPGSGWAWQAPFFQVFSLVYARAHKIAVWPNQQQIATPRRKIAVASEEMRASVVFAPGDTGALERANFTASNLQLVASTGWRASAGGLRLAAHREEEGALAYRLALSGENVVPPALFRVETRPGDMLPPALGKLEVDAVATFDAPWDQDALNRSRPQPTRIALRLAEAHWGRLELLAAGTVDLDSAGLASGRITVKARNWREILTLARDSGQLPDRLLDTTERGLELLSRLSGNKKTLDIPLTLEGGQISLGIVPLGNLPPLRLR